MAWRNLLEGLPRKIYLKLFENWLNTFRGKYFNQLGLKECDRGLYKRNISTKLFENWPDTFGGEDFLSFHYFCPSDAIETRIVHGSKRFEGIKERTLTECFLWSFIQIGQVIREDKLFEAKSLRTHTRTDVQQTIRHDISSTGWANGAKNE